MSSRQEILARIRQQRLPETAYPAPSGTWITFADRVVQFSQVLQSVGGQVHVLAPGEDLTQVLRSLPCLQDARQIVCALPDVPLGNVDCEPGSDPHSLAGVDVAIVPGEFGVALGRPRNMAVLSYAASRSLRRDGCFSTSRGDNPDCSSNSVADSRAAERHTAPCKNSRSSVKTFTRSRPRDALT